MAASAGAGQHIAEPLGRKQCIELNDLHRLSLPWQPPSEQAPIAQGQRLGPVSYTPLTLPTILRV